MKLRRWFLATLLHQLLFSPAFGSSNDDDTVVASCSIDEDCEAIFGVGAECKEDGHCANNPFEKGCLYEQVEGWTKKRVCNSQDPFDAESKGICRKSDFNSYMEVSIFANNWQSSTYLSWILQILLSEMLDVPTRIETGKKGQRTNFYDNSSSIDYGKMNYNGFVQSRKIEDWRISTSSDDDYNLENLVSCGHVGSINDGNDVDNDDNDELENYVPCGHVEVETWSVLKSPMVDSLVENSTIESPRSLGLLGNEAWYIPKFTAERDPSLSIYFGLRGDHNRAKLANRFLRPTTWKYYCNHVSINNCTNNDGVATRPPNDESENNRMFFDGSYIGHFRKTEDNDCLNNPNNCTGHFADYPCGWRSYALPNIYHQQIPLQTVRYSYQQLTDIWYAANATKSDVMMMFWQPEVLTEKFVGTDAAFIRVTLPEATTECINNRVPESDACSGDFQREVGSSIGSCDNKITLLHNVISTVLRDQALDSKANSATRSPAFDAIDVFQVTNMELNAIFKSVFESESPREGVCKWVADNIANMKKLIPPKYPRTKIFLSEKGILYYFSLIMSTSSMIMILVTWAVIHQNRHTKVIRNAQYDFICFLLAGCLFISTGALFMAIPTSNASCAISEWFVNLGYTLELMPMLVKVAAINHLVTAAKKIKRTKLKKVKLFEVVIGISMLMVVFLTIWTIFDRPKKSYVYYMDESTVEEESRDPIMPEEAYVNIQTFCKSNSKYWSYGSAWFHIFMLLSATILAFQSRSVRQDFNETQSLAIMIYSNALFSILRLITYFLSGMIISERELILCRSVVYSADSYASVIIYILPKLLKKNSDFVVHFPSNTITETQLCKISHFFENLNKNNADFNHLDENDLKEISSRVENLNNKIRSKRDLQLCGRSEQQDSSRKS